MSKTPLWVDAIGALLGAGGCLVIVALISYTATAILLADLLRDNADLIREIVSATPTPEAGR